MQWQRYAALGWMVLALCWLGACSDGEDAPAGGDDAGGDAFRDAVSGDGPIDTAALDAADADAIDGSPVDTTESDGGDIGVDGDTADGAEDLPDSPNDADTSPPDACTLSGAECAEDQRCAPLGAEESLVCSPIGDVPVGGECAGAGTLDDCQAGAACVTWDADSMFCARLCELGETGTCTPDVQLCVPWFGRGGTTAGVCLGEVCQPPAVDCDTGERCTVLLDQVTACVPDGTVAAGGDCSVDSCRAGAICRGIDGDFVCRPFCETASDCPEADTHCVWPWSQLGELGFCRPGCDPVARTGCDEDEGCYFMDPEVGSTDCWTAGDLAEGEDCSSLVELCEPGLDCVLEPGSEPFEYSCRAYCDTDDACPQGRSCQWTEAMGALRVCL